MTIQSVRARACLQAAVDLHPDDAARVVELHDAGVAAGQGSLDAIRGAVRELLAELGAQPVNTKRQQAMDDLRDALADLGEIFSKGSKSFMVTPEQEAKLVPVLARVFDAAFRAGYHAFKDAAGFVLQRIRDGLGAEVESEITMEHLQGAYIMMSGRYRDQGADKPAAVVAVQSKEELKRESSDVSAAGDGVERGGAAGRRDGNAGVRAAVRNGPGGPGRGAGVTGAVAGAAGGRSDRGAGVADGGAAAVGERGNQPGRAGDGQPGAAPGAAGGGDAGRGAAAGGPGVHAGPQSDRQAAQAAAEAAARAERLERQRQAESVAVEPADADNIAATLPLLLPGQQADVLLAERRFAEPDGYGMLFTNGTGTGKTFTGLGIVKRMARQGRDNILILAPNDKIIEDWIRSGRMLGLEITKLRDTKDAGRGIVVATYANAGANAALVRRQWDALVADEAHYLSSGKDGNLTAAAVTLRALALHPQGAHTRADMLHPELVARERQAYDDVKLARTSDDQRDWARVPSLEAKAQELSRELKARREEVKADVMARQGAARPRAIFLSATPFAYEFNIEWGDGFLFEYDEGMPADGASGTGGRPYNSGDNRDRFFMRHFGYRMRYNKLTQPESTVDRGLMQRQFNGWLKQRGVLSGRMLDVAADYDRRFVLVDSGIGARIDEALHWFDERARMNQNATNGYRLLREAMDEQFDYLSRMYLLESLKAQAAVPYLRQQLALGRKIVVFHDFKQGGAANPFTFTERELDPGSADFGKLLEYNKAVREFREKFPDLAALDSSKLRSPIATLTQAFGDRVRLFNGDIPAKQGNANVAWFNDDATGPAVLLVQAAKAEGWSGHDTTGKHQRVLVNLGLPVRPFTAIQQEGRIYRTGQVTDAIFRYLNTGTGWERSAFAQKIAVRASAAENLAMGEQARALKDAFIAAFEGSDVYEPGHDGEGQGGKEADRLANEALTAWDRAKSFYWATQKKTSRTKAAEGVDYFATPEPLGFKLVEWADARGGETMLEPSAGHGAIARWMPSNVRGVAVEPSTELRSRLALAFNGSRATIREGTFEDFHITNKADTIVMNPPFGVGGKTAWDHVAKAAKHLRDGGRLVAIVPRGTASDRRFDAFREDEAHKDMHLVADIMLPMVTFERAGTAVGTRVVVFDKGAAPAGATVQRDLGSINSIHDLFDRLESMELPRRAKAEAQADPEGAFLMDGQRMTFDQARERVEDLEERALQAEDKMQGAGGDADKMRRLQADADQARAKAQRLRDAMDRIRERPEAAQPAAAAPRLEATSVESAGGFDVFEFPHSKTGATMYGANFKIRVDRGVYDQAAKAAKALGGWYSSFKGGGVRPGFLFKSAAARDNFVSLGEGARFSAGSSVKPGQEVTQEALEDAVEATLRRMPGTRPTINVLEDVSELPAGADIPDVAGFNPSGAVIGGRIYLFRRGIGSTDEAVNTIFHELFHFGVKRILPAGMYQDAMRRLADSDAKVRQYAAAWAKGDEGQAMGRRVRAGEVTEDAWMAHAIEEGLADVAEELAMSGGIGTRQRATVRRLASWLASVADLLGMRSLAAKVRGMTHNEAEAFVMEAIAGATRPGSSQAQDTGAAFRARGAAAASMEGVREFMRASAAGSTKRFNALHRTIATQLHKASVDRDFAQVFQQAVDYERDIARAAARPAEVAPDLLPTFDDARSAWARLWHGNKDEAGVRKAGEALFAGTLENGPEPGNGVIWSDAELRSRFGLDEKQIKLYRQARAAIDASLDETAAALAYEMVKAYAPDVRADIRANPRAARQAIRDALDADPRQDAQQALADAMAVLDRAEALQAGGYAPLMRFGRFAVDVTDPATGERLHFEKFESELQAKVAAARLAREYPGASIERSVMSEQDFKLFAGVDPESVALFANQLAGKIDDAALQEWYRNAVSERSAFKRMIGPRKGMAGYSADLRRVIASFITSNARLSARQLNMGDMAASIADMRERRVSGDVIDEAIKLKEYLDNPDEPFKRVRGLMFAWYLGGSVASAAVNLTQPVMMTLPYLSQFGNASKALAGAVKEAASGAVQDADLAAALKQAAEDGKVDPQEIHHLYHEGMGSFIDRLPFFGKLGADLKARAQGASTLWGWFFGAAENFNRRLTFIAAYRMAQDKPALGDPYAFAVRAIDETQGIYGKSNRPNWARGTGSFGAVGVLAFTFKQYSIAYVELLVRLAKSGTKGKMAAGMMLGLLALASGLQGLPGADDLEDLVDTVAQRLGYRGNSRAALRETLADLFGASVADVVMYGGSAALPLDLQGRLGMGNLLPATALLKPSENGKAQQLAELIGPAAGLAQQVGDALDAADSGKGAGAILGVFAPLALRNAMMGLRMAEVGYYADMRGRKVTDTDELDAALKGIGFQPTSVSERRRPERMVQQDIARVRQIEADVADLRARAIVDGDPSLREAADDMLRGWNERNPELRIRIADSQVLRRVREMRRTSADRLRSTAPRETRRAVAEALE